MSTSDTLHAGSAARKTLPIATGVLDYFPAALAEVAKLSRFGNDKHNPGMPLHHSRGKSSDHADCIMRHLVDRGTPDPDMGGLSHSVAVAWRALALLQEELEAAGAPMARGAWFDPEPGTVIETTHPFQAVRDALKGVIGDADAEHLAAVYERL